MIDSRTTRRTFGLLALAGAFGAIAPAHAKLARVTIGTNPAGTLYNQIGAALSTAIQQALGIPASARPFSGSSVYLPQLQRGEIEFGINSALDSRMAYRGEHVYKQAMTNLRATMLLWQAPYQYFVRADAGIRSVADLRGKRIVTTFRAIASFDQLNDAILATGGLTRKDVTSVTMSGVPDAIRGVVDGSVDAAPSAVGIPALREADAAISGGIRFINLGPNHDALHALPGIGAMTLKPGPAFAGVKEPTTVSRFDAYLNTGVHLSAEDVYTVTKTLMNQWPKIQEALPALRGIRVSDLAPVSISHPYHEGAIRAFKEAGMWTPEHQKRQDQLKAG